MFGERPCLAYGATTEVSRESWSFRVKIFGLSIFRGTGMSSCPRRNSKRKGVNMISRVLLALCLALPLCAQVTFTQEKGRISVSIDGKPYTDFFLSAALHHRVASSI